MRGTLKVLDKCLHVDVENEAIIFVEFCDQETIDTKGNPILIKLQKQLDEYSTYKRLQFDVPLYFEGTDFQKKVWEALLTIPYGEVKTYKQIAEQIGHPKAFRAVGGACNKNPIGIIIPCHRVIGTDHSLTGYAGGLDFKELLLKHEHVL